MQRLVTQEIWYWAKHCCRGKTAQKHALRVSLALSPSSPLLLSKKGSDGFGQSSLTCCAFLDAFCRSSTLCDNGYSKWAKQADRIETSIKSAELRVDEDYLETIQWTSKVIPQVTNSLNSRIKEKEKKFSDRFLFWNYIPSQRRKITLKSRKSLKIAYIAQGLCLNRRSRFLSWARPH